MRLLGLVALTLLIAQLTYAQEAEQPATDPVLASLLSKPYSIEYEARYRGFKATGEGTLEQLDTDRYRMRTVIDLRLFGQSLTSIDERSEFRVNGNGLQPEFYRFEQNGLGSRNREQHFNHAEDEVRVVRDDEEHHVALEDGMVLDEVSAILYLRSRLAAGEQDISFSVLDGDQVETHRYQAGETAMLETPLGQFEALRVDRIREPGSDRSTTFWFATRQDYLLLRLEQIDPRDRKVELVVTGATLNGSPVKGS